jgi:NAD(P)-dependent dehydrogenase (short-subunit alcohol dehydrogenase family)
MKPILPITAHLRYPSRVHQPRIVFVTGATRGLGFALVERALACGDLVIGTYRDEPHAADLFDIARRHPNKLHLVPLDVASEHACATLEKRLPPSIDHVDVLINNAGINATSRDIDDSRTAFDLAQITQTTLDCMMRTNVFGPLFVTRALLPLLTQSSSQPRVINVSSRRGSL